MKLKNYMDDGANWQAQAVLAYLRSHDNWILDISYDMNCKDFLAELEVGRFENCREQGYVFTIYLKDKAKNYTIYEHRNSDSLCVMITDVLSINTPTLDQLLKSREKLLKEEHPNEDLNKYNMFNKEFSYGAIVDCGDWIVNDMKNTLKEWLQKKS